MAVVPAKYGQVDGLGAHYKGGRAYNKPAFSGIGH